MPTLSLSLSLSLPSPFSLSLSLLAAESAPTTPVACWSLSHPSGILCPTVISSQTTLP